MDKQKKKLEVLFLKSVLMWPDEWNKPNVTLLKVKEFWRNSCWILTLGSQSLLDTA